MPTRSGIWTSRHGPRYPPPSSASSPRRTMTHFRRELGAALPVFPADSLTRVKFVDLEIRLRGRVEPATAQAPMRDPGFGATGSESTSVEGYSPEAASQRTHSK